MKTVSDNFNYLQNSASTTIITRVYYKRRYWNAGSSVYVYESDWTELARDEYINVSGITEQLDNKTLQEFKVSNVILKLKNNNYQWDEYNTNGKFAADSGSSNGYEPYLTKFLIKTGYVDSSGNEDIISMFTGVAVDFNFDSLSRLCVITVNSLQQLLLDGNAENVYTTSSLETIGTGDSVTKNFFTSHNGIRSIEVVTVNSVELVAGADYSINGLGDIDNPVQITLASPAATGYLVKCTYTYWKKNKTVDEFISDLVSESGITSSSISNATLGTISNHISKNSKADFSSGTNTSIDLNSKHGAIKIDFYDSANYTLFQDFNSGTLSSNGWADIGTTSANSASIVSNELKFLGDNSGEIVGEAIRKTYGRSISFGYWSFDIRSENTPVPTSSFVDIWFIANQDTASDYNGYYIRLINEVKDLQLWKQAAGETAELLGSYDTNLDWQTTKSIKITRDIEGIFNVYVDSTLYFSAKDDSISSGDRMVLKYSIASTSDEIFINDIYIPVATATATHISESIDTKSGLDSWGTLAVPRNVTFGTLTIETRVSTDNSTWDSWTALSVTNAILSAVKRYIQVRLTFSLPTSTTSSSGVIATPPIFPSIESEVVENALEVYGYTVEFSSDRVFIAMGNFSRMNCYQAISELAKFSSFEWGVNYNETFFFRARNTNATPDLVITESNYLSEVNYYKIDYSKLYSGVRVRYGSFIKEVIDTDTSRTSAFSILKNKKVLEITGQSLVNKDTNVTEAIADIYIERLGGKRRYLRIKTRYLPQLELADTVSVRLIHNPEDTYYFLNSLIGNVISISHDPSEASSSIELEEIL